VFSRSDRRNRRAGGILLGAVRSEELDDRRLRVLLEVSRALAAELDLEALLRRLLDAARDLTGARYAAVGVLDERREELERFITVGVDEDTRRSIGDLPRGRGILGELIRDPRPLRLADIGDHPRSYGFPPGHPPMRTFLGVPVIVRGQPWGNLYLSEKEGGEFDEADEAALSMLADWAAIAIANARAYGAAEERRDQLERAVRGLEATTAIARALGGETRIDRVLELIVKRGRALVEARAVLILLERDTELEVAAAAGDLGDQPIGSRVAIEGSAPGQVLRSGRAERLADVRMRMRLSLGDVAEQAETALLVPLQFRGRTSGVLIALDRLVGERTFDPEDERLLNAFASAAATAVATAQSVESERLERSIAGAEQERRRWARELHDQTLQGLGALQVLLRSVARGDGSASADLLARASEQLTAEIEALQQIISDLRPASLDDIGLAAALGGFAERAAAVNGLELGCDIGLAFEQGSASDRLVPTIEDAAFRLVQEAFNNIAKHARATRVRLRVEEDADEVTIVVEDDGTGFDTGSETSGFGLVGMRERAELVGGSLEVESAPGSGTRVRAVLPARRASQEGPREATALSG
jgi:signal transduction histidine kinase